MKNKKIIISGVLSVAAVFSLLYGILTPPKVRRRGLPEPADVQKKEAAITAKRIIFPMRETKRSNYSSWGRNPFSESISKPIILTGIIWDNIAPQAVINSEIVKTGDEIYGNTVIEIKRNSVILSDGTKDFELELGQ